MKFLVTGNSAPVFRRSRVGCDVACSGCGVCVVLGVVLGMVCMVLGLVYLTRKLTSSDKVWCM